MSSSFQSYVFGEAVVADGLADFGRVKDYLLAEEIISEEVADNTLEEDGHEPGRRASSIVVRDDEYWRCLSLKGVSFQTGNIIEASNELELGTCPHCRSSFQALPDEALSDVLFAYSEGRADDFECPRCGKREKLTSWDFGHGLAVGNAIARFWNWPDHVAELASRFSAISGMKCTKVWGRI